MKNNLPVVRPRRLRGSEAIRLMVRETKLDRKDLIAPLFVTYGEGVKEPVASMPGVFRYSVDLACKEAGELFNKGIMAIILFGIPAYKDPVGGSASDPGEAVQRAVQEIKECHPELFVMTDVCLCEYTDHGHCGIFENGVVLNDATLERLAQVALSHVKAGADAVAPSDMMDGRVRTIRAAFDNEGYHDRLIISYAVKYASAFYGPFRSVVDSAPQEGDRRSYQMDPANIREALREARLDEEEAADMIMVKPALAYLDVIRALRETVNLPLVTYNVSGEYAMVKAAAAQGLIDGKKVALEQLLAMKRAGADLIITYFAKEATSWLENN